MKNSLIRRFAELIGSITIDPDSVLKMTNVVAEAKTKVVNNV